MLWTRLWDSDFEGLGCRVVVFGLIFEGRLVIRGFTTGAKMAVDTRRPQRRQRVMVALAHLSCSANVFSNDFCR